jgi:BirA family transcriptional regulator, biotin operon repressor / biotin---[acetyl-CoA-carboxylase] ligase
MPDRPPHTLPPWNVERHAEVTSTNDLARERIFQCWADNMRIQSLAFTAERQTFGRGQHGRRWESPTGGLYLSAIVHDLEPRLRPHLALIAGVAVGYALRDVIDLPVQLRWPNDVVVEGKKLGGILCEAVALEGRWGGIVGIGLNVNTRLERLPPEVRSRSTSVFELMGRSTSLDHVELFVLARLSDVLRQVRFERLAPVANRFAQWDALSGHQVIVEIDGRTVEGLASGITEEGFLRVDSEQGETIIERGTLLEIDGQSVRARS